MELFEAFSIRQIGFADVLDILIIWFIFYSLFRFIQGSRAMQMSIGLLALFAVQFLAQHFQLQVLSTLIGSLFNIIPIAIIVLFQDEIRRMLASIGRTPFVARKTSSAKLDQILQAALDLSKTRTGALIVFERKEGLQPHIEQGVRLEALPSGPLIKDIFQPKSSLHDGAVIVSESRLMAAACVLPLSRNPNLPKYWGTRHRAAIGISEETDCIALVVSEETGRISLVHRGVLRPLPEYNLSRLIQIFNQLAADENGDKLEFLNTLSRFRRSKGKLAEKSEKPADEKREVS